MKDRFPLLLVSVALLGISPVAIEAPRASTLPAAPAAAQRPARDRSRGATASGIIRGRVVSALSGAPLRRARVEVSAGELPRRRAAESDGEGRFEFTDLPPGRFTLAASKTGYATLQFGQRHSFERGQPIDLALGQVVEDVVLALPKGGALSGRITDETGEPIAATPVAAMRWRYQDGERQLTRVGRSVETNDRGEFRLFELPAGSYVVGTTSAIARETLPYGMAYYAGASNPADAQLVPVKEGEERSGLDFVLPVARLARISGTVVAAGGEPLTDIRVHAVSGLAASFVSYRGSVTAGGTFVVSCLPPGRYDITASAQDGPTGQRRQGVLPVEVSGVDLAGLFIRVTPGSRVAGRVVFEADGPPPFAPDAITIWAEPVEARLGGPLGTIKGDWTFELTDLSGSRLIRLTKLPPGWALKSVILARRDITDTPLDLTATGDVAGVTVVVTDRVTCLSGRISDRRGQPAGGASVVVFAADRTLWGGRSRFVATVRPDRDGNYRMEGLPAGAYLAVALEYLEDGATGDPAFLESLRPGARRITLQEGEIQTLDLPIRGEER